MIQVMEIIFDLSYLAIIWYLVFKMKGLTNKTKSSLGTILVWAFTLLALGDTGHVGFRVLAYLKGGTAVNSVLLGWGKLATAITVTGFYALLVEAWKKLFEKRHTTFSYWLLSLALIRLIIIFLPGNNWTSAEVPFNWSIYRNLPLLLLGLGVAYLFLASGLNKKDPYAKGIGVAILVSYTFYTPVILWAKDLPLLGLLMIPKTIAYIWAAFIAYKALLHDCVTIVKNP